MEIEEYKFDHFKNIDEVMYCFNYWYKEEDIYSINRYLSLKDFNYISNKYQELQKENKELKEELEDMTLCRDIASGHRKEVQDRETILLNQQKEFINYLEDEIHSCEAVSDLLFNSNKEMKVYKEILQKYKEIIGDGK
jgi:hypothetical protein|nr:MAG TPA: hypothetical protein [Caudoviricetes sp.]